MSFLSPTWVEKAKELASAATELGKRASDIAVEAVEGLKAGQRPELVEIEGRTLVLTTHFLDEAEIPQAKVPYLSNPPLALPCSWSTDWHSESAELGYES